MTRSGLVRVRIPRHAERPVADSAARDAPPTDAATTVRRYLMYGLLPGWLVPSLFDWWYHRRSRIEDTTGLKEAMLHTLMGVEIPIIAALNLRITRPVFLGMATLAAAHTATSAWDVKIAYDSPRAVVPGEQRVHGFMEVLPIVALATVGALHWQQIRHPQPGEPAFARRVPPLPKWYLRTAGAVAVLVAMGPYRDEMTRCIRAARRRRAAPMSSSVD
jgi:hypothetical protein